MMWRFAQLRPDRLETKVDALTVEVAGMKEDDEELQVRISDMEGTFEASRRKPVLMPDASSGICSLQGISRRSHTERSHVKREQR